MVYRKQMLSPLTVARLRDAGWLVSDGDILVTAASKDEAMRRYRAATTGNQEASGCDIGGCAERPVAFVGTDVVCGGHYVDALYALKQRRLTPTRFTGSATDVVEEPPETK